MEYCSSPTEVAPPPFSASNGRNSAPAHATGFWAPNQSSLPGAWHTDVLENASDRIMLLKPTTSSISVTTAFDLTSTQDNFHGYYLNIKMGRLTCSSGPFSITAKAIILTPSVSSISDVQTLFTAPSTSLLPETDMAYTLELGKLTVPQNARTQISVKLDIVPTDASQGPIAGLFLQLVQLQVLEITPQIASTRPTVPTTPGLAILEKKSVATIIPTGAWREVRGVRFSSESRPGSGGRQDSLGSRLQRRVSIPVRQGSYPPTVPPASTTPPPYDGYGYSAPAGRLFNMVRQPERWRRAAAALLLARLRDLLLARLVLRWIAALGQWMLGQSNWLTPGSFLLFWLFDTIVFKRALGRFSCLGALCTLSWLPGGTSLWKTSIMDACYFGAVVWGGGYIDGRFFTAEEIAEFEQMMLVQEFWRDFWQNVFNPAATNRAA